METEPHAAEEGGIARTSSALPVPESASHCPRSGEGRAAPLQRGAGVTRPASGEEKASRGPASGSRRSESGEPTNGGRWGAPPPPAAHQRPCEEIDNAAIRRCRPIYPTLSERLASTPHHVRAVLLSVTREMQRRGLSVADSTTLEIVVAEALNNVVEHAYGNEGSGWILVEIDYLSGWVVCRLTDGGHPMPNGTLPSHDPLGLPALRADLPEGGFGWSMIHELTRHLSYRRIGKVNSLSFALPLSGQA